MIMVDLRYQPPKKTILIMNPAKNTIATDARINPVRKLLFFCSGVDMINQFYEQTQQTSQPRE